jgi:hypothetical protein
VPLRLPRHDERPSRVPRLAAGIAAAGLALLAWSPVSAATLLQNPSATPASGTTDTTFVLSVDYVSDPEARPALSASVEVVGLGGSPLPMALVAGDDTNGTWQTSTMLPAGTWDLIFRADASGSDPDPAVGLVITVIDAATPTPSPSPSPGQGTPAPTSQPTASPSATATASPHATAPPTPVPTPLPPGVTPTPRPAAPSASPPATSPEPSESNAASASARPSDRPSGSERPSSATSRPTFSLTPSASADEDASDGSGWGRAGWIVLGGLTSAAGAAVLARQWLVRRAGAGP